MPVTVALEGKALRVNGERVRRGWGFTRKNPRGYYHLYKVVHWRRNDVVVAIDREHAFAGDRFKDFTGYDSQPGTRFDQRVMPHEEFARFVQEFYGSPLADGENARLTRAAASRVNLAHKEASETVASIQAALNSPAGIYAVVDLLEAAKAKGYEEGFEAGQQAGYDVYSPFD